MSDTRFLPGAELLRAHRADRADRPARPAAGADPRRRCTTRARFASAAWPATPGCSPRAADVARFARMLLGGGALDGTRVLSEARGRRDDAAARVGDAQRALGWDVRSEYSRLRGTLLSERAFGHGGYTGTSLWIDPRPRPVRAAAQQPRAPGRQGQRDRARGRGRGRRRARVRRARSALRGAGTRVCCRASTCCARRVTRRCRASASGCSPIWPRAAATACRRSSCSRRAPGVKLAAIFSPEHGLEGKREGVIARARDAAAGRARATACSARRAGRTPEMLRGPRRARRRPRRRRARASTRTCPRCARCCARPASSTLPVLVLDRPNPLGGVAVEGPVLDDGRAQLREPLPAADPPRTDRRRARGADERRAAARRAAAGGRGARAAARELRSRAPACAGAALAQPEERAGRPALPRAWACSRARTCRSAAARRAVRAARRAVARRAGAGRARCDARELPGVRFAAIEFTPKSDRYARERCRGVRLTVTDAAAVQARCAPGSRSRARCIAQHRERVGSSTS